MSIPGPGLKVDQVIWRISHSEGLRSVYYPTETPHLGPPLVPLYFFWWEGSLTKIDYRKSWYPYSILSTGGPKISSETGSVGTLLKGGCSFQGLLSGQTRCFPPSISPDASCTAQPRRGVAVPGIFGG